MAPGKRLEGKARKGRDLYFLFAFPSLDLLPVRATVSRTSERASRRQEPDIRRQRSLVKKKNETVDNFPKEVVR